MGNFNPHSLSKEDLDKAVRTGKIADYHLDGNTQIIEISTRSGGYVLKLKEYVPNDKEHIQMDFVYDSDGKLIDKRLHKF